MNWSVEHVILLKLGLASLLGLLLGIEREVKRKPVGMKTSVVISVAACLLTIVSIQSSYIYAEKYIRSMDPLRLAAQIVSGIGFIGAGVILRRSNEVISGLTTAAIVWASAAIGIAVGAGFYLESVVVVVVVIFAVEIIPLIMKSIGPKTLNMKQLHIKLKVEEKADMTEMLKEIKGLKVFVKNVRIKDLENKLINLYIEAMVDEKRYPTDVYQSVKGVKGVLAAEVEGA